MVTIKDVAKMAGVSPSTASIVLRGLGNERNISTETQERVIETAKRLPYHPNTQSKLLRSSLPSVPTITLFWDSITRQNILSRFLLGIQNDMLVNEYQFELQVRPYTIHHLQDAITKRTITGSSGIIICNASENDMEFLENNSFPLPIVLYNRYSSKYPTINMNDKEIGTIPADVFIRHKRKKPALLKAPANFNGMNIRTNVFLYRLNECGIRDVREFSVPDSVSGGFSGAEEICALDVLPDCLLCTSTNIAFGALNAFHKNGVSIPDDLEIICVGNGIRDVEEYSIPSLSVVSLPMENMAGACLHRLVKAMDEFDFNPDSTNFPVEYIARESCPD